MAQIMDGKVLDLSAWQDERKFEVTFRKLLDGLELVYV
jgi:hypothetical protein